MSTQAALLVNGLVEYQCNGLVAHRGQLICKEKKNARFIPVPMCSLYLFSHSAHVQSKKRPLDENRCFESSQAKIKMEKLTAKQVPEFKITESALMNTSINHMRREEIH
jgi:hypothetical protein